MDKPENKNFQINFWDLSFMAEFEKNRGKIWELLDVLPDFLGTFSGPSSDLVRIFAKKVRGRSDKPVEISKFCFE